MWEFFNSNWPYLIELIALVAGIAAAGHAIMTKRDVRAATGWVAIVLLSPFIGAFLYTVFGINRIRLRKLLRRRKAATARLVSEEGPYRPDAGKIPLMPERFLPMKLLGDQVADFPLLSGNHIEPLESGDTCYNSMLRAIDQAKSWVLLETYIFDDDRIGQQFVERLSVAALRGVAVRVLLDAIGTRYSRPSICARLAAAKLPYALYMGGVVGLRLPYANLRTHRKLLIVDGAVCFMGGMNIRAGFSAAQMGEMVSYDTHFRINGPVVEDFAYVFAGDWLFASGELLPEDAAAPVCPIVLGGRPARVVPSGPDHQIECTHDMIMGILSLAVKRVVITTPYFLPDRPMIGALAVAARRGVLIDILVPSRSNLPIVDCAVTAQLEEIIEIGCRVWRSAGPFDHSKLMAVDGEWAYVGSSNLDPRSFRLNFEIDIEIYDPSLAIWIEKHIDSHIAIATPVTSKSLASRVFWKRLRDRACWLASPFL